MITHLINANIFDGFRTLEGYALTLANGAIQELLPQPEAGKPEPDSITIDCQGKLLCPGFIDTQVNGAADHLFNDDISTTTIRAIGSYHRHFGTTGFLPTLISPSRSQIRQALTLCGQGKTPVPGCLGVHIEGPFLNPVKRGVHPKEQILDFSPDDLALLSPLNTAGTVLLTLAPEQVSPAQIKALVAQKVIVSLGHSNADYDTTRAALAAGASGFTHLFNAMSALTSRAPGMVGAALMDPNSWCGIIVDCKHVHPASLSIALKAKAKGKMMLVTDAVHACGSQQATLDLLGETICQQSGKVTTMTGTLAGSNLTMIEAVKNTHKLLDISLEEALRMASLYPAQFLGLDHQLGCIAPGYQADLIALDVNLNVTDSWIAGQHLQH